jgi:hypothetical protein
MVPTSLTTNGLSSKRIALISDLTVSSDPAFMMACLFRHFIAKHSPVVMCSTSFTRPFWPVPMVLCTCAVAAPPQTSEWGGAVIQEGV